MLGTVKKLFLVLFFILFSYLPNAWANETLKVVTSFSVLEDFVQQLGGDRVVVETILPRQSDPHSYQIKPSDVRKVSKAEVIVFNGHDFDGWMTRLLGASKFSGKLIISGVGSDSDETLVKGHGDHGHMGHEHEGHEEHGHMGHEHEHEGHEEHGHMGHEHEHEGHEEHGHMGHEHEGHEDHGHMGHEHEGHEEHDHMGHEHEGREGHGHMGHEHEGHEDHGHMGHEHEHEGHEEHGHMGHEHEGHEEHGHMGHEHEGRGDHKHHKGHGDHGHHKGHRDREGRVNKESGHDHDHGDYDPHVWHDPNKVITSAREITRGLIEVDSSNESYYLERLSKFEHKVKALYDELSSDLSEVRSMVVLIQHGGMEHFSEAFDINFESLEGLSGVSTVSGKRLKKFEKKLKDGDIDGIAYEYGRSGRILKLLSAESCVNIDGPIYIDNLGEQGGSAGTWSGMMRHNASIILSSLTNKRDC